jgi:hypothetical protein
VQGFKTAKISQPEVSEHREYLEGCRWCGKRADRFRSAPIVTEA